jgi:hypothetical protein
MSPDIDTELRRADELVAQHRALEAIDTLTSTYRERKDPRLACKLVEVRHAAFTELSRNPGRPAWPAQFADPFPGEHGIVEAAPQALSGDLLGGAITNHGCLRVDGMLDEATTDRLRNRIEAAFVARERVVAGAPLEEAAPAFVPYAPGQEKAQGFGGELFIRLVDSPETLCDVVEVFTNTGIRSAVAGYLGERPAAIANKWILRRSPTGVVLGDFHQDGAFLGEGIRTVDCWVALSHCGPGTGRPAIDLVPRRMEGVLPSGEGSTFTWSLAEGTVATIPDVEIASPVFAPGDVLFFDERLVHRTTVGTDLETRYAIESWFVAPSSYPAKHLPVVF